MTSTKRHELAVHPEVPGPGRRACEDVIRSGDSAATAYVAGVIALMMQKKSTITVGEVIKSLLAAHATKDPEKLLPKGHRDGWGASRLKSARRLQRHSSGAV